MTVRVEKNGAVTTVIHSRAEARNAMDPVSADALTAAFLAFDADPAASVAVFWGVKNSGSQPLEGDNSAISFIYLHGHPARPLNVPKKNNFAPVRN